MAKSNIEFLGNLSRQQVLEHLAAAKALIFPGVEDFGITPLEALASGTPVVAFAEGGALETLTSDTAEFFDKPTAESLQIAITSAHERTFDSDKLKSRASHFSREYFINNIKETISEMMAK